MAHQTRYELSVGMLSQCAVLVVLWPATPPTRSQFFFARRAAVSAFVLAPSPEAPASTPPSPEIRVGKKGCCWEEQSGKKDAKTRFGGDRDNYHPLYQRSSVPGVAQSYTQPSRIVTTEGAVWQLRPIRSLMPGPTGPSRQPRKGPATQPSLPLPRQRQCFNATKRQCKSLWSR